MKKEEKLTLLIKLLILLSLISFAVSVNDDKNRLEILKLLTGYSATFSISSTKKEKKNKQISNKELEKE